MVDFGEFQPFEDVEMIRPSITVLSKDKPGGEMRLFKWLTAGRPPEALSEEIAAAPTVSTSRLEDAWELEPDSVLNLREKLSSNGNRSERLLRRKRLPRRADRANRGVCG